MSLHESGQSSGEVSAAEHAVARQYENHRCHMGPNLVVRLHQPVDFSLRLDARQGAARCEFGEAAQPDHSCARNFLTGFKDSWSRSHTPVALTECPTERAGLDDAAIRAYARALSRRAPAGVTPASSLRQSK